MLRGPTLLVKRCIFPFSISKGLQHLFDGVFLPPTFWRYQYRPDCQSKGVHFALALLDCKLCFCCLRFLYVDVEVNVLPADFQDESPCRRIYVPHPLSLESEFKTLVFVFTNGRPFHCSVMTWISVSSDSISGISRRLEFQLKPLFFCQNV